MQKNSIYAWQFGHPFPQQLSIVIFLLFGLDVACSFDSSSGWFCFCLGCSSYLNSCEQTPQWSSFDHFTVLSIDFSSDLTLHRPRAMGCSDDKGCLTRALMRRAKLGRSIVCSSVDVERGWEFVSGCDKSQFSLLS